MCGLNHCFALRVKKSPSAFMGFAGAGDLLAGQVDHQVGHRDDLPGVVSARPARVRRSVALILASSSSMLNGLVM